MSIRTMELPKLLTIRSAADALGLSESYTRRLIREGKLPVTRIGGAVRVAPSDLTKLAREGVK